MLKGRDPEAFHVDALEIVEVNADARLSALVVFDLDDIDAAFDELDARYLAGEAGAHARTWSVITRVYTALNRHEISAATPDWVTVDHRPVQRIGAEDVRAYLRATWDVTPDIKFRIEEVHRLSSLGVVVTRVATGSSQEGFDAEWRQIDILTVDGDVLSRVEVFDEADIDAALARFDELSRPAPLLENAATRTWAQLADAFNRHDVAAFLALTSPDGHLDDRRTGVRDFQHGSMRQRVVQTLFEYPQSWRLEIEHVASRGSRLSLSRQILRDTDDADRPITIELLTVLEVGEDNLAYDFVNFDADDIDGAFAELDARYLAGEAAAYSRTWSVVKDACAAFNRRESPPTTPDWATIDHRRAVAVAPGDMTAYVSATLELTPDVNLYIEAVHRLSDHGAVVTHVSKGTSQQGFDAEWRLSNLMTVDGDLLNRSELFDEADIDAALERFNELSRPARRLENAATQGIRALSGVFPARDWAAMTETLVADDTAMMIAGGS